MKPRVAFGRLFLDFLLWILGSLLAGFLRFDGDVPASVLILLLKFGLLLGTFQLLYGIISSLYLNRYRIASFEEVFVIAVGATLVSILGLTFRILFNYPEVPRSIPLIAGLISMLLIQMSRIFQRPINFFTQLHEHSGAQKTLIYGAGLAGRQLAEQMIRNSNRYVCVGFLDDDESKSNLRIFGMKIYGGIDKLESTVRNTGATILIVAIADINSQTLLKLEGLCRGLGISIRVIPTAYEIAAGAVQLADISEITEENLLGRRPVQPDESEVVEFIRGKRILVTGAGGSIGSEIVRQVMRYGPKTLTMLDRDESALLNLQLSLDGTGLLLSDNLILADVRDSKRIDDLMYVLKPEVVFHAAALKHLTTLERFPEEAHKTNILGTRNVLVAAQNAGVETFVNISTDKAAEPTSVLGKSKLITEQLTAGMPDTTLMGNKAKFISVRFGNVIGSNGSFIHTFRYQIKHGGPLTVTHPDVTRFFMTVSEAVHLVLQSAVVGAHGETLILDMGEPVRIADIAKRMIDVSGRSIEIVYTGLRPGEKLHETLFSAGENVDARKHQFIMHTHVEPMQVGEI